LLSNKLAQFFEGPAGSKSSKRLIGIVGGIALIYLAVRGGEHFLAQNNSEAFLRLFDSLAIFVAGVLGLGLADYKIKKENEKVSDPDSK
jgi:hypothetical protein